MYNKYIKRLLDLVAALTLLTLAIPLLLVIAIAVKLSSPGPVIFTQERSGINGTKFKMFKLRTMDKNNSVSDASGEDQITGIGRFLRAFSLDEIPQLVNVVRGDMSFIGPRPWITDYYDHMDSTQRHRYDVRPGITGIAQVYGRNNLSIHDKIKYDLRYVSHIGLREDLKVIFLTIQAVVSRDGQEMGKGGIHKELDILRSQLNNSEDLQDDSGNNILETAI
ncbi:MAG: hypothetical protein QG623_415 [Patescibacteria group bacterium]|nr:hypothetical protein [Patescibacteria group bacterium]MDQ5913796.1 hypothetical protein [Patescibacteria group bacterium]